MKIKSIIIALLMPVTWFVVMQLVFSLPFQPSEDYKWFISGITGTLIAFLATYIFLKIDKSSFKQIGLSWGPKTFNLFSKGFLIGTSIALVMMGIIIFFSDLEITRNKEANLPVILFWLLAFIPLAFMEEIAFRGFAFIKLNKVLGLRLTLIITSILFAYYHDVSGNSFFNQLLGPGIWGILYGVTAIWSDGLAVPTGIHVAANVILAVLGMKEDKYAIWYIDYSEEITEAMQTQTSNVGVICQIILLILGIFLTEWYLRNKKGQNNNVHYV